MALLWGGVILCLQTSTFGAFYLLLAMCTCLIGGAGWWFVSSFALPRRVMAAMLTAIAVIASAWAWQRLLFIRLVPAEGLRYGYFLTPEGRSAGMLVLKGPMIFVAIALAVLAVASMTAAWRSGARWSLFALLAWWVALYAIFVVPSAYLDAQGNASVFV